MPQLRALGNPFTLGFVTTDGYGTARRVEGPTPAQLTTIAPPASFARPYLRDLVIFEPAPLLLYRSWNEPPAKESLRALSLREYEEWITDPRLQELTLNELWPNVDLENSRRDRLTEIVVALAREVV